MSVICAVTRPTAPVRACQPPARPVTRLDLPPQDLTAGAATFELVEDSTFCLRLRDVQVSDAGAYTVVDSNRHGTAQRAMSLHVTGKGQWRG